jgi:hypothetical protein
LEWPIPIPEASLVDVPGLIEVVELVHLCADFVMLTHQHRKLRLLVSSLLVDPSEVLGDLIW